MAPRDELVQCAVPPRPRYSAWALLAPLLGVMLGLGLLYGMMRGVQARYEGRINPGVSVHGVPLGGMTEAEARQALGAALSAHDLTSPIAPMVGDGSEGAAVVLTDGGDAWAVPWSALGLTPDIEGTVAAALAIGRDPADRSPRRWVRVWLAEHPIEPLLLVNANTARRALVSLAEGLYRAPIAGTLELRGGRVAVLPGAAGRELDVERSLEALLVAAQAGEGSVPLAFRALPAPMPDPGPLQAQVDDLVRRTITVFSYDPVVEQPVGAPEACADRAYRWELGRAEIASWLRLAVGDGGTPEVTVDPAQVKATLVSLAADLGDGRGFRLDEAMAAVEEALRAGGGSVTLYVTHSESRYTVQPGDTGLLVAARHGMPLWPLAEANPGVDLDALRVGQELVIPSQEVLTPNPPVPGKRIVVAIGEQRMRVYQDGAMIHEWPVATGREGSPTHTGVFQVLSKEESAYASLWDLHMPHFVGIYAAGPGFTNGIHALPILSSGQRLWAGALGTPVSYGCIILGVAEAEELYGWAEVGVTVEVRP